jgi:hypothetical protein
MQGHFYPVPSRGIVRHNFNAVGQMLLVQLKPTGDIVAG